SNRPSFCLVYAESWQQSTGSQEMSHTRETVSYEFRRHAGIRESEFLRTQRLQTWRLCSRHAPATIASPALLRPARNHVWSVFAALSDHSTRTSAGGTRA